MAATPRTDIYRPSAPDFDPAEFELVGVFDLHPEEGTPAGIRGAIIRQEIDAGYRFASVHPHGQCDHCGARFRFEAVLRHLPTHRLITVGEQCLDNRFAFGTAEDFAALRAEARRKAEETRERNRRHEIAQAALAWLADADPRLAELSYRGNGGAVDMNDFLSDIARKLLQYGDLTLRQEEAAANAITRDANRRQREENRERETEIRQATAQPAPTGRVVIEGTVGATWTYESDYGTQFKFRVTTDAGWVAISTVPAAIFDQLQTELGEKVNVYAAHAELRDRRVRFTATLTPTEDDPTAAWAKRPTKAELLVPVAQS